MIKALTRKHTTEVWYSALRCFYTLKSKKKKAAAAEVLCVYLVLPWCRSLDKTKRCTNVSALLAERQVPVTVANAAQL